MDVGAQGLRAGVAPGQALSRGNHVTAVAEGKERPAMKNTFISQVFPAVTNDFLFHSLLTLIPRVLSPAVSNSRPTAGGRENSG